MTCIILKVLEFVTLAVTILRRVYDMLMAEDDKNFSESLSFTSLL